MDLYSQRDIVYENQPLPESTLTIHQAGCFLCSIATLGQVNPVSLMETPGGFVSGGLLLPGVLAKACGMVYVGPSSAAPKGWCIGRTSFYAPQGSPTHFLLVNMDTQEMVDPLKFPAVVEPLTYPINQFRIFTGVKFQSDSPASPYESPADPTLPDWAQGVAEKAKKAGIQTPLTDTIGTITLYHLLAIMDKYDSIS